MHRVAKWTKTIHDSLETASLNPLGTWRPQGPNFAKKLSVYSGSKI